VKVRRDAREVFRITMLLRAQRFLSERRHEYLAEANVHSPASRTLCSVAALLRRADVMQVQGRSDEIKVRKRLRKIADLPLRLRIVFFREQADIVANR
jgi:hypothetical protein